MQDTRSYRESAAKLLDNARKELMADMESRGIGAIVWNLQTAGFHFIPEIVHHSPDKDKTRVARITGLYAADGNLWLVEEERSGVSVDEFYNPDTEVRPTVVTLTPAKAAERLGDPDTRKGFTLQGTLEEWLTVADCYFEALAE